MILTQMSLNTRRRDARRLLASPQAMHAAVLAGFPPTIDAGRVLWRIDEGPEATTTLWVTSRERPDFTHLEEQAGWPQQPTFRSVDCRGLLEHLAPGQAWAFRLTANPTHRGTRNGRKQVFAHVTVAQQTGWLLERQQSLGIALEGEAGPTFTVISRGVKRFRRNDHTVTLGTATFGGLLKVTDADRLRAALTDGIGRAKAYGCGLMTLARP